MTAELVRHRTDCRLCGSEDLAKAIPMRPLPIVSPNVGGDHRRYEAIAAPADVYLCNGCGLLQLSDVVDPSLQYDGFLYTTGVSLGLDAHFAELAESLVRQGTVAGGDLVVEIGSNDGTLLSYFKNRGLAVLGVDPAIKIAEAATAAGIPTLARFFDRALAAEIRRTHGPAKLVIANNTLANLDRLDDVIAGVQSLMADDGVFIFETQYALDVLQKTLLDVIYHEHLTYFSVNPLVSFFARRGMEVANVERIWPKGGSIRVHVRIRGSGLPVNPSVGRLAAEERAAGLFGVDIYREFNQRIAALRKNLHGLMAAARQRGGPVAAYGASVGCVALIHQLELSDKLDIIFDDTPLKPALVGTARPIPIKAGSRLEEERPAIVVVLAWRYASPIARKHGDYIRDGGRFVTVLPEVRDVV